MIMASSLIGYLTPTKIDDTQRESIELLSSNQFWDECQKSIEDSINCFVNEGLAENFAVPIYGEDMVGPWVKKTDLDTLNGYIKPIIKEGLEVTGFDNLTAYLYGDEIANMRGFFPVGLPYCAEYACGYHMIKHYLKKTGKTIIEATLTPTEEILREIEDFWDE